MFVPPAKLLRSLHAELSAHFAADTGEASTGQGITAATRLLASRERGEAAKLRARLERLGETVDALGALMPSTVLAPLRARIGEAADAPGLPALEAVMRALVTDLEAAVAATVADPAVTPATRLALARQLGEWEVADRRAVADIGEDDAPGRDTRITRDRFEAYLRARFGEPGLAVTAFQPLAGGFGKQTILVEVEGEAIGGGLVIRRDPEVATVDNDCHRVVREYPVIRAVFERGFPAPDALWLDSEHDMLPGGDFILMRRAAGRTGGNVFGATERLSPALIDVLAGGAAGLHALPPLHELGEVTDSIRPDLWDRTLEETTRDYVEGWRDIFLANVHNPSPALIALFGWLLDNVPAAAGRPVLVHGDIGFHNMLIDEGCLSALVDWEFAHIGDPAEDLGSIRNVLGDDDWAAAIARYRAAGGTEVSPERLHFFRVWQHVRNAAASNLSMGKFETGEIPDLKLAYTGHFHFPIFIRAAWALIEAGPEGETGLVAY